MRQCCQCIICRQWCQWVPVPVLQETAGFRSHPVPSLLTSVTLFTMMMMIKMVPFLPWWWWWWWHPVASPQPMAFISPPSIQTVRPSALAAATTSTTTTTVMTTTTTTTVYIACTMNCSCTDTAVQLNVNVTQCTSLVYRNVMLQHFSGHCTEPLRWHCKATFECIFSATSRFNVQLHWGEG